MALIKLFHFYKNCFLCFIAIFYILFFQFQKLSISEELNFSEEIQPVLNEIKEIVDDRYIIENVSKGHLKNGALDGMLRSLDPYSTYFDKEEYQQFKDNTNGKFYGIGIEMSVDASNQGILITSVISNSPAEKAGLIIGDIITHINDQIVIGKKINNVAKMIKGEQGTSVKLTLYRYSTNETFSRTITRDEIKIQNVISKIYGDKIAIMQVKLFNHQTYTDFVSQLNSILKQYDIEGLIIDLRNNPGGLLESAVDISNLFLKNGQLITSVRGRNGKKMFDYVARNNKSVIGNDIKIVILVNRGSASASEVLSGCLQDYGIATLIGERTFGKALVQEIFNLKNSQGAIKLTTGQYHTPKDRKINGVGIEPDIKVNERKTKKYDAILQTAINYIKRER